LASSATLLNAKAYNIYMYIAPQAANAAVAALLCHTRDRAGMQKAHTHGLWPANKQPCTAGVCRLMVSIRAIHVITWITTHLPTTERWKA